MKRETILHRKKFLLSLSFLVIMLLYMVPVRIIQLNDVVRKAVSQERKEVTSVTTQRNSVSTINEINVSLFDQWGNDSGSMNPHGLAFGENGYIYVSDVANDLIQVFTKAGTFIRQWGGYGSDTKQFDFPASIAIDSTGNVYVCDTNNNRVQVFTSTGTFIRTWGSGGAADGKFANPYGIAINSTGYVYVCDTFNGRVQVFTSTGTFVGKWEIPGFPYGIAVDDVGDIYVADYLGARVQVFTSSGTFIRTWGSVGTGDGQFNMPQYIAFDSAGFIYVTDSQFAHFDNNRVQVFAKDGTFITKWGSYGFFAFPNGIAIDDVGYIYVADHENDLIKIFAALIRPQLHVGMQYLIANNRTINVTLTVVDSANNKIPGSLLEISNNTNDWTGITSDNGQYNLSLDYIPTQITLQVNASKIGYSSDNQTSVIYIDPPAVFPPPGITEPSDTSPTSSPTDDSTSGDSSEPTTTTKTSASGWPIFIVIVVSFVLIPFKRRKK